MIRLGSRVIVPDSAHEQTIGLLRFKGLVGIVVGLGVRHVTVQFDGSRRTERIPYEFLETLRDDAA